MCQIKSQLTKDKTGEGPRLENVAFVRPSSFVTENEMEPPEPRSEQPPDDSQDTSQEDTYLGLIFLNLFEVFGFLEVVFPLMWVYSLLKYWWKSEAQLEGEETWLDLQIDVFFLGISRALSTNWPWQQNTIELQILQVVKFLLQSWVCFGIVVRDSIIEDLASMEEKVADAVVDYGRKLLQSDNFSFQSLATWPQMGSFKVEDTGCPQLNHSWCCLGRVFLGLPCDSLSLPLLRTWWWVSL